VYVSSLLVLVEFESPPLQQPVVPTLFIIINTKVWEKSVFCALHSNMKAQQCCQHVGLSRARILRQQTLYIALMMEPVRTSETSVYYKETTRRSIQEGCHSDPVQFVSPHTLYAMSKKVESHNTPMKAQGERRYSSYSLLT
jgi:hypothetical protein